MIEANNLALIPDIRHGFFTREGGYSKGLYAGLNCGYGSKDQAVDIDRNRRHVATALGLLADQLLNVYQIHSADTVTVEQAWPPKQGPRADAMVTTVPGLALAILTADCAPVLLADQRNGVIGAAHAGWRGALHGVVDAVLDAMIRLGAREQDIQAAIGPAISKPSYEVGRDLYDAVLAGEPQDKRFFSAGERDDHFMFDLTGYVADRLIRRGLKSVETVAHCTYLDDKRFYSYRRATHRGEPDYGRQISAITLGPATFI
jgi:YfiH family protein